MGKNEELLFRLTPRQVGLQGAGTSAGLWGQRAKGSLRDWCAGSELATWTCMSGHGTRAGCAGRLGLRTLPTEAGRLLTAAWTAGWTGICSFPKRACYFLGLTGPLPSSLPRAHTRDMGSARLTGPKERPVSFILILERNCSAAKLKNSIITISE